MTEYRLNDKSRSFSYQDNGNKKSVLLRQIIALIDFNDVRSGTLGGWIGDKSALSQGGSYWIYDENVLALSGVMIVGGARITQASVIRDGVQVGDAVWVDRAEINHNAQVRDNVTIQDSVVRGECPICGDARIVCDSEIIAARRLIRESDQPLQIYERAAVNNSRIVYQAQTYGDAMINCAFIEHRAEVFGFIWIEDNEENNAWICDCVKIHGHAHVITRTNEDTIPILRYSLQVTEHVVVEGNCVLKHHVLVGEYTQLRGGPSQLDGHILIEGYVYTLGEVLIEYHIEIADQA